MNGVESYTDMVGPVYADGGIAPPVPAAPEGAGLTKDNMLSNGYISSSRGMVSEALGASGFIDIAGGVFANFTMLVSDRPEDSVDMEDLKPGMMTELVAWVASELAGNPEAAQNAQGHIDPQRAVRLLS